MADLSRLNSIHRPLRARLVSATHSRPEIRSGVNTP
jgi:hypothetical protein